MSRGILDKSFVYKERSYSNVQVFLWVTLISFGSVVMRVAQDKHQDQIELALVAAETPTRSALPNIETVTD